MTPGPVVWSELFASTVCWFLSRISYLSSYVFLRRRRSLRKGAFLWGHPDQDQCSEITRIMVHQRNRWIHYQSGFVGSFDAPWSESWSWITDPDSDHPKGTHLPRKLYVCLQTFLYVSCIYLVELMSLNVLVILHFVRPRFKCSCFRATLFSDCFTYCIYHWSDRFRA